MSLSKAWCFATERHAFQRRKNAARTPYITHPVEVVQLLIDSGVRNETVLCAAMLHDTIEDTGTKYEELAELFGQTVADIVQECSDDKSLSKVARKMLQVEHAETVTEGAKLVKLADKLSNLRGILNDPPADWTDETKFGYFVWSYTVTSRMRGVNEQLDAMLDTVYWVRLGEMDDATRAERLKEYYESMSGKA